MARIQTPRFARLLQAFFNLQHQAVLPLVGDEVVPVSIVAQPGAEFDLYQNVRHGAVTSVPAAVAGQQCGVFVVNPSGSGKIVVIESCIAYAGAATTLYLAEASAATATTGLATAPAGYLDTRLNTNLIGAVGVSNVLASAGSTAALFASIQQLAQFPASTTLMQDLTNMVRNYVAAPGTAFGVVSGTSNQSIGVAMTFRERAVPATELAPG